MTAHNANQWSEAGLARVLEAVKTAPYNGPWTFLEEGCTEDEYNAGRPLTLADAEGNDVANFYSSDDATVSISREQAIKNVRLAAAAQDLLEALREMLKQFTKTPSTFKDSEIRGKAHAAIAKATGEQS